MNEGTQQINKTYAVELERAWHYTRQVVTAATEDI